MSDSKEKTPTEIKIPVPWGHVAGKIWGNPSGQLILAVHGRQDNCGVYDRLIGLLCGNYYIVVIDLPGHGFSSHFPSGLPVLVFDYIVCIMKVINCLKWDHFVYLGHSLGGQIGIFFTALYPNLVKKLIVIDHISPPYVTYHETVDYWRECLNQFFKMESRLSKGTAPVYTYQEALNKLTNRDSVLTNEAAEIVLRRSLKQVENGYEFCMDQRLKIPSAPFLTNEIMIQFLINLRSQTLFIFCSESYLPMKYAFKDCFECIEKNPNISIVRAVGNHDLHQNHPERISGFIDEFLSKEKSKL